MERYRGRFQRVIPLDEGVDPEKIDASYKEGVLRVTVPKTEVSRPKRITVKT